jgi:hypothetical protein
MDVLKLLNLQVSIIQLLTLVSINVQKFISVVLRQSEGNLHQIIVIIQQYTQHYGRKCLFSHA